MRSTVLVLVLLSSTIAIPFLPSLVPPNMRTTISIASVVVRCRLRDLPLATISSIGHVSVYRRPLARSNSGKT